MFTNACNLRILQREVFIGEAVFPLEMLEEANGGIAAEKALKGVGISERLLGGIRD